VAEFVVADTSVLSLLTKSSGLARRYDELVGARRIAVSFQTVAELLSSGFSPARQVRLDSALAMTPWLPHSDETSYWYAQVANVHRSLRSQRARGRDAGDADMGIIASAAEYGCELITHDRHMLARAQSFGHDTASALLALRADSSP
jgi:predicted nucleic acid-binding protein